MILGRYCVLDLVFINNLINIKLRHKHTKCTYLYCIILGPSQLFMDHVFVFFFNNLCVLNIYLDDGQNIKKNYQNTIF